jgi:protein ImuA
MQGLLATADSFTEVPNRTAVLEQLRRLLPGMADSRKSLPFGLNTIDSCLPEGGLVCGALHEIVPETQAALPTALGFVATILARLAYFPPPPGPRLRAPECKLGGEGLGVGVESFYKGGNALISLRHPPPYPPPQAGRERVVFVLPTHGLGQYGRLYGHGLKNLGLDPARLILVEASRRQDILWAIEEAVRSGAPAAVAGVIDRLDLKTSQRLQFFAIEAGLPLFLLRPAQNLESSAAATRWRVGTAEAARDRFGLFARARWHLRLERVRNGRPGEWVVEYDHVAHRFSLAAALADSAFSRDTNKKSEKNENAVRQACRS